MNITFSRAAFASILLEHTLVMYVHKELSHHHWMVPARAAPYLVFPQKPLYAHLVDYFAHHP
jgi:hypothetical protein